MKSPLSRLGLGMLAIAQCAVLQGRPVQAQMISGPEAARAIRSAQSYPSSAQRFFGAGQAQFEADIQQLQRLTREAAPLLQVQPDAQPLAPNPLNQKEPEGRLYRGKAFLPWASRRGDGIGRQPMWLSDRP